MVPPQRSHVHGVRAERRPVASRAFGLPVPRKPSRSVSSFNRSKKETSEALFLAGRWSYDRHMVRGDGSRALDTSDRLATIYRDLAPAVLGYLRGSGAAEPEDLLGDVFVAVVRGLPDCRRRPRGVAALGVHRRAPSADRRTPQGSTTRAGDVTLDRTPSRSSTTATTTCSVALSASPAVRALATLDGRPARGRVVARRRRPLGRRHRARARQETRRGEDDAPTRARRARASRHGRGGPMTRAERRPSRCCSPSCAPSSSSRRARRCSRSTCA